MEELGLTRVEGSRASALGSSCRNGHVGQFRDPSKAKENSGDHVYQQVLRESIQTRLFFFSRSLLFFPISLSKLVSQAASLL